MASAVLCLRAPLYSPAYTAAEYVEENGNITRQSVEEMLEIGTTRAYRLLKELCEEGKLQTKGSGKGVCYTLK